MSYFKDFNLIKYDLTIPSDTEAKVVTLTDLTTRNALRINEQSLSELTDKYIILGNETPESISYKLYGTPFYHWAILYINGISDVHSEWPLSDLALKEFATKKYTNVNDTHHFEVTPEMIVMDYDFAVEHYGLDRVLEVTNIMYEEQLNDFKRYIKVIKPQYISPFVDQFKLSMING